MFSAKSISGVSSEASSFSVSTANSSLFAHSFSSVVSNTRSVSVSLQDMDSSSVSESVVSLVVSGNNLLLTLVVNDEGLFNSSSVALSVQVVEPLVVDVSFISVALVGVVKVAFVHAGAGLSKEAITIIEALASSLSLTETIASTLSKSIASALSFSFIKSSSLVKGVVNEGSLLEVKHVSGAEEDLVAIPV